MQQGPSEWDQARHVDHTSPGLQVTRNNQEKEGGVYQSRDLAERLQPRPPHLSFSLSLSLSLSLTHALPLSLSLFLFLSLSLSLSHTHTFSVSLSLCLSLYHPLSLTFSIFLSLSLTHRLSLFRCLSLTSSKQGSMRRDKAQEGCKRRRILRLFEGSGFILVGFILVYVRGFRVYLSILCILSDIRRWAGDSSASSCLVEGCKRRRALRLFKRAGFNIRQSKPDSLI